MSGCNQSCSSCNQSCSSRTDPSDFLVEQNEFSNIKKVIGVVSGKGGVGKSIVTSMLASEMAKRGKSVAIMDADITGPSIPKAFGITRNAQGSEKGIIPITSKSGIKLMSLNLLVKNPTDPVVWRGPIIANTVKQFWTDVVWEDVDYLFVDMPPGTGDVALTVFQSLPVDGIIMVTSPQDLVAMIVSKALNMATKMNIPVLGIVENMSYFECPDCKEKINVFGKSNIEKTAKEFDVDTISRIPINPNLSRACDDGTIEDVDAKWIKNQIDKIEGYKGR